MKLKLRLSMFLFYLHTVRPAMQSSSSSSTTAPKTTTMKALMEKSYDKPMDMELVTNVSVKEFLGPVGPNQVQIAVKAAALNPIDGARCYMQCDSNFPIIVGYDVAGVVQKVGSDVKNMFKVGDRVFGDVQRLSTGRKTAGTMAEYCIVDADLLVHLPDSLSFVQGAAMPVVGLTCIQALGGSSSNGVQKGDKVFITGGAGGVGIHAIQMAKHHFQASRVATTASAAKMDWIRQETENTVDIIVDYKTENAGELYLNWADFCLDTTKDVDMCKRIAKTKEDTICSIADFSDPSVRTIQCRPNQDDLQLLAKLLQQGKVKPVIDRIYPLQDALEAMEYQMSGRAKGKIIIQIADD